MTVRRLDETGDLPATGDQFLEGYTAEEVAQNIRTRLKFFFGEWFLDTSLGTDWFGKVLGKATGLASRETEIRRNILLAPGLAGLTSFTATADAQTRQLTVTASGTSTSGALVDVEFIQAVV